MNKLSTQVDDAQSIINRQDATIANLEQALAGLTEDLELQKKLNKEIKKERKRQELEIVKHQTKAEQLERCLEYMPQNHNKQTSFVTSDISSQNLTMNEETAQLDPTMSFDVYVPELHYFNNSMMQTSMNEQQILHKPNFVSPDTSQVEIEPDDIYNISLQQTDEKVRRGHLN